ncbi:MAG: hypothetical protein R3B09_21230 [Nannocystaceae bacterium]
MAARPRRGSRAGRPVGVGDGARDEASPGGWGDALDRLAEAVFASREGRRRAEPLLAAQDAIIGGLGLGDHPHAVLQAHRVDWALCDMQVPAGEPGETWAYRASLGRVPEVTPTPEVAILAGSIVGLFEVWRARGALILRERLCGVVAHLAEGEAPLEIEGEVGLWETRIVLRPEGARLCRPPIAYPVEILPWLERAALQRWTGTMSVDLLDLRAMWLRWRRAPGAEPGHFFTGHGG